MADGDFFDNPNFDTSGYIQGLEQQNEDMINKNVALQRAVSSGFYPNQEQGNLIEYQLDTNPLMERIEHYLRGDVIKHDEHGEPYYDEQTDEDLVQVNKYGLGFIMNTISFYLEKMTTLSFYQEERINEILADLGDELADYIFCNLEKMGMNTKFKRSRYKILVLNILHIIESDYRRALGGNENEAIRRGTIVTQNQPIGMGNYSAGMGRGMGGMKKKFNLFSPKSW
jgi:hypothetical protein